VGSEGFSRFPSPHLLVGSDGFGPKSIVPTITVSEAQSQRVHPKTLIEMWIICLDPVSANSEKGRGSEWAVRVV